MRRWIALSIGTLLVAAFFGTSSVSLLAADKTVSGTVAAVSADSITVKVKEAEWKLTVDTKTKVVGKGVGTKDTKMKEAKKSPQIIDFIKAGDQVTVKYDDVTKHAAEVRLTKAAAR